MTVLFDADDVAENFSDVWVAALNDRYGTAVTPEDVLDWDMALAFPTLTREQVFGILKDGMNWEALSPVPDSREYLRRLQEEGHELYMVTATDYRTCRGKFDRILTMFPFLRPERIIVAHRKQMVRGDVLIDDRPENLMGGHYIKLLFDRPHNRKFEEHAHGMRRVFSWPEIYRWIHDYSGETDSAHIK